MTLTPAGLRGTGSRIRRAWRGLGTTGAGAGSGRRRRRFRRGFGNGVGLWRIGFRRRERRRRHRRHLLRFLGRLRLGGWSFVLSRFFGRRRVALRLVDLFGFGFTEIL